jgi:peptidylprolyl isomerase
MRPNDSIISIDGNRNLPERPISEIGALLTGEIGTDIELVVKRRISRTDESIETFKLVREETTVVPKTRNVNIEGGGGLFIGASGPRPPPVIFIPEVLAGMRTGGRRTIMVSPDVGYEDIGEGEIPPGASFKLEVELLQVKTVAS